MSLQQGQWAYPACGAAHDRDINAALNIQQQGILEVKAAGHVVSPHGGQRKSANLVVAA
ncbi:hypothetical protein [Aeromonas sp. QDB20]|uniref:hypothetical protein n=1 Tax=Aeromonas sp. QDB20 TaxID=2989835 RepID=UPI003FA411EF